jgi:hypothetical protein
MSRACTDVPQLLWICGIALAAATDVFLMPGFEKDITFKVDGDFPDDVVERVVPDDFTIGTTLWEADTQTSTWYAVPSCVKTWKHNVGSDVSSTPLRVKVGQKYKIHLPVYAPGNMTLTLRDTLRRTSPPPPLPPPNPPLFEDATCRRCYDRIEECTRTFLTLSFALDAVSYACVKAVARGRMPSNVVGYHDVFDIRLDVPLDDAVAALTANVEDCAFAERVRSWLSETRADCFHAFGDVFRLHGCLNQQKTRSRGLALLQPCEQCVDSFDDCLVQRPEATCRRDATACATTSDVARCCLTEGIDACSAVVVSASSPPPSDDDGSGGDDLPWPLILGVVSAGVVAVGVVLVFVLHSLTRENANACATILRAVGLGRQGDQDESAEIAQKALDLAQFSQASGQ